MKTVIVDGIRFTLSNGKNYHYNSKLRKHLHQYVWERQNGKIPKGHEIHHKDLNTLNNNIDNLELMKVEDHRKLHSIISWNEERRKWARNNLREKALPKAKEWHGSEEGIEWHKKHYEKVKDKFHTTKNITCESCGEEATVGVSKTNRFCSNKCKSKWRRDNGLDDEKRVCVTCDKEFTVNKYSKSKNCSKSCMMVQRHRQNKLKDSPNLQE